MNTGRRTFLQGAIAALAAPTVLGIPSPASAEMTGDIVLENSGIRAAFDAATGGLIELVSVKTGWRLQRRRNLAKSFEMVVPLPKRLWNVLDGLEQVPPQVTRDDSQVTFHWPQLRNRHAGVLDISVEATATLTGSGLRFDMRITNGSAFRVESVAYPYIGDLSRPSYGGKLVRASWSYCNLVESSLYPVFRNERGYWGTEYPIQMVPTPESPCLMILADREGLYVGCHDASAKERVEFTFQLKPGFGKVGEVPPGDDIGGEPVRLEFAPMHLPFVQPGEGYEVSPIVLEPFEGDWHAGADIYRRWRKSWLRQPRTPSWLADVHSWQMLQMSTWGDALRIRYTDLPRYVAECARHGVKGIQLIGWTLYGQDGRLPIHDIDPRLGTREELRAAIAEAERLGVKIVLYEKYTCTDVGTDWYKRELYRYASRDLFGNTHGHEGWQYDTPSHLAGINTRPYAWMCMNSKEWQDICLTEIARSLDLRPAGIFLDEAQWHGKNAFYCFEPDHGHRVPAYNFAGDAPFAKRILELLESQHADMVLGGEGPFDLQNQYYTLAYTRAGSSHIPAIRYIDPRLPIMNRVYGYDDREAINVCLLNRYILSYEPHNFRGHLEEFPLTLEYGKKMDALRRRYRQFLWDAEFQDTLGAQVAPSDGTIKYSVFRRMDTGKRAVVLANQSKASVEAKVRIEGTARFHAASPEDPDGWSSTGTLTIPARSAVVLMEA